MEAKKEEKTKEVAEEEEEPHEGVFLVLPYLPLFELLSMSEVCVSLRDAVTKDVLPWLSIIVQKPLDWKLTDEILFKIASKSNGKLTALALINCFKITDDGLLRVIHNNPFINKLCIPGCTSLTPEGVIRAVNTLSKQSHTLKCLMINGIYNLNHQHLESLQSCLKTIPSRQDQKLHQPLLYYHRKNLRNFIQYDNQPVIDVEICPKCNEVRTVYECPMEKCNKKRLETDCRGCMFCIPRCEECGGCVKSDDEVEETVCGDVLCSSCWLHLPKCNFCNKPHCSQHGLEMCSSEETTTDHGFVCDVCHENFTSDLFYIM